MGELLEVIGRFVFLLTLPLLFIAGGLLFLALPGIGLLKVMGVL